MPFLVIGIGGGGFYAIKATEKQPEEEKSVDVRPTVEVQTMVARDHQVFIESHGEVMPLEQTQLAAQVSGEVLNWHPNFVPGGLVKRGEILFTIDKSNYQAAVLQAEAELVRAEAALIEENARAQVAAEEARRVNKRHTDLFLRKPQVLSAEAAVKSAKASLQRARRDLADCEVVAPYDALIISRSIGVGQFVSVGAPVAVLNNIETAEIMLPIAGFDQPFLSRSITGLAATIELPGPEGVSREGIIARDLGVVDSATRMTHLVVRITDPYSLNSTLPTVKFGTYVRVSFPGKVLPNIFRISQEAVTKNTVWILGVEDKLEPRRVKVVREEGEYFLISDGLSDQDKLITTLPEFPQRGMAVKVSDNIEAISTVSLN